MISKKEIEHIARLARLELTEKEVKKMQKDLSEVLDYFNVLKKAPRNNAETRQPADTEPRGNELRKDEAKKSQISDEIMGAAPNKKDNYIKVKTIL